MHIYNLVIIASSFAGFLIALYIALQKRKPHPVVCPMKGDCDAVVKSEHSKFFHIPVEYLGIAYYLLIFFSYLSLSITPSFNQQHPLFTFSVLSLSLVAFLFSIYLTFIQAFLIRRFCTWCLLSAFLCTIIFIAAINGSSFEFLSFLVQYRGPIVGFHVIGLVLGLGGAVFSDILLMRFLKDLRISKSELYILKTFSQIIWFGLAISIVSGIGLYLPDAEGLNQSAKFIAKMTILLVVIVNGAGLNLFITPKLTSMPFGEISDKEKGLREIRRLSFAMAAISIISWLSVFILGMMRTSPFELRIIFGVYLLALFAGIAGSQVMEYLISKGKINT